MKEFKSITDDTQLSESETKELQDRFSDPTFVVCKNHTTVRDLAETLDLDTSQVAEGLASLRGEKTFKQPAVAELDLNVFVRNRISPPYSKAAFVLALVPILVSTMLFLLHQPASMIAPQAPTPAIEEVPNSKRGPEPNSSMVAPTNPAPNDR